MVSISIGVGVFVGDVLELRGDRLVFLSANSFHLDRKDKRISMKGRRVKGKEEGEKGRKNRFKLSGTLLRQRRD